jgi:hypothetical protein
MVIKTRATDGSVLKLMPFGVLGLVMLCCLVGSMACGDLDDLGQRQQALDDNDLPGAPTLPGEIIPDDPDPPPPDPPPCPYSAQPIYTTTYHCNATAKGQDGLPKAGQTVKLTASWCWTMGASKVMGSATKTATTSADGVATIALWSAKASVLTCEVFTPEGVKVQATTKTGQPLLMGGTTLTLDAVYPRYALPQGQWLHLAPLSLPRPLYDTSALMTNVKGNPRLFVRYGAQPDLTHYSCAGNAGADYNESCTAQDVAGPSSMYVSVYAESDALFDLYRGAYPSQPAPPSYTPGEKTYSNERPQSWTIEDDGKEGLDYASYDSVVRSPYIQNVTNHSATLLWRVSVPTGQDPSLYLNLLQPKVWVAPEGVPLDSGTLYTKTSTPAIKVRDVSNGAGAAFRAYRYDNAVTYNSGPYCWINNVNICSAYWLNSMRSRPVVELELTVENLAPSTNYHYRVRTITADPLYIAKNVEPMVYATLAEDVVFRTAPALTSIFATKTLAKATLGASPVRFLAMGDLGPGDDKPSYYYDVFDLFHDVARVHGADLWLALGDLDNDTDGHPNAVDPFFFNVYNAYVGAAGTGGKTSAVQNRAGGTGVQAFLQPPYLGLLGGLPVFPTFGNHDICEAKNWLAEWLNINDSSYDYWLRAYYHSFVRPAGLDTQAFGSLAAAAQAFNAAGEGFFYTFRRGKVIFISLGIPKADCETDHPVTSDWKKLWGIKQSQALETYLAQVEVEAAKTDTWVVVYFHDHNHALGDLSAGNGEPALSEIMARHGVDLVLVGHDHKYYEASRNINVNINGKLQQRHFQVVVAGTGGFGDDSGDPVYRPGFIMVEVEGNQLRYWKYDTHYVNADGKPADRETGRHPTIQEFRTLEKLGPGRHAMRVQRVLDREHTF